MKKINFILYPVFIVVSLLGLGFAGIGLGLFPFTVSIESQSADTASLPVINPPSPPPAETVKKLIPALPKVTPALPTPTASPAKNPEPVAVGTRQGNLRVSNPTEHPVRVALLSRHQEKTDTEPAHWDFSPMEGGSQGLMLSLPQGGLKLKKGDILVAFAQDGSRLYWGPYVVGETPAPIWNPQKAEWQLVLQP
jgi:hypothetical protein